MSVWTIGYIFMILNNNFKNGYAHNSASHASFLMKCLFSSLVTCLSTSVEGCGVPRAFANRLARYGACVLSVNHAHTQAICAGPNRLDSTGNLIEATMLVGWLLELYVLDTSKGIRRYWYRLETMHTYDDFTVLPNWGQLISHSVILWMLPHTINNS